MTDGMSKRMGVFIEMERNMISERVKSGVTNARAKGKAVGRPALKLSDILKKVIEIYELYKNGAISKSDCAKKHGISIPNLDKYIKVIIEGKRDSLHPKYILESVRKINYSIILIINIIWRGKVASFLTLK